MYYIVIGFAITVLISLVASLFFESNVETLNPKLFFSAIPESVDRQVETRQKRHSTVSKTVTFSINSWKISLFVITVTNINSLIFDNMYFFLF